MSERKFLVNRFRIGLVGLVVVALFGLTAGGAVAATGRGTAAASITLLDVSLGNVQNIKVLSDEGQGTLDAARLGLGGNRAYGQLTAVNASGVVNQVLPNPPQRAEAPGTTSGSLSVNPIPISFPPSTVSGVGSLPIGAGLLASGVVNPVKVEAFLDAAGARSAVGTDVPNLSVLQGLLSVDNVKVAAVSTNASPSSSKGDSGVLSVGSVTVLDLDSLLGGLGVSLPELSLGTLTSLVDGLGLPVPTGSLGLGDLSGAAVKTKVDDAFGLWQTVKGVITQVNAAADCSALDTATAPLGGIDTILAGLGLPSLGLGGLLSGCPADFATTKANVLGALTSTGDGLVGTIKTLTDGVFSVLAGAPLLQVSGIELSALANATDTLAGSSASTSAKFGTVKVGNSTIGVLDPGATVNQINALKSDVEAKLASVTSLLGLNNLISVGIMERSASTKTEGLYNVADAAINALRVTITPPADIAGALNTAGATLSPVSGTLSTIGSAIPADTGLADGVLAQALGLTSLLSQPTTIVLGAVHAQGDFTTASAGVPTSPSVSGELPRTGGSDGAWVAALAALALAGAFGLTRTLRKAPVEG